MVSPLTNYATHGIQFYVQPLETREFVITHFQPQTSEHQLPFSFLKSSLPTADN